MKFTKIVFVLSDKIEEFKDKKGKDVKFRQIAVVSENDTDPIKITVPIEKSEFDITPQQEYVMDFNLKVYFGKIKLEVLDHKLRAEVDEKE